MGIQDLAIDIQTKNESLRRLGGTQEENVVGGDGQKKEDEAVDDG